MPIISYISIVILLKFAVARRLLSCTCINRLSNNSNWRHCVILR